MSDTNRAAEISAALMPAYQHASKLKINKAEAKQLQKPFADKQVEIHPQTGAIYLPHIYISERLNQVFGPGAWALICRDHKADEENRQIRAEHVLVIRGCVIGESVDEFVINPLEAAKYGDALEATAAKALRKICGKRLSCGSQVWQPDYCQKWIEKFAESVSHEGATVWKKKGAKLAMEGLTETPMSRPARPKADDNLRHVMLQLLSTQGNKNVLAFAIAEGILTEGQVLDEWPLDKVAVGEREIRQLQLKIQKHFEKPPQAGDWKEFIVPMGAMKGQQLGKLDKEDIAGYWGVFTDPANAPVMTKYPDFKTALEAAGAEMNFQKLKKVK